MTMCMLTERPIATIMPTSQSMHTSIGKSTVTAPLRPGACARASVSAPSAWCRSSRIFCQNNAYAAQNRQSLAERGIFALNLVSSPGSGKTTLLCKTIAMLDGQAVAVIEGDQQTSQDAERIRATGAPAIQINTGRGCHLDAHMVGHAMEKLNLTEDSLLMIENVGNLVCPAAFDLGEAHKVAILSVTEGEDKPIKYPDMFRVASLMLLNKIDLLPHLDFDVDAVIGFARRVNPQIRVIRVSATSGEGMGEWLDFLRDGSGQRGRRETGNGGEPKRRIAQLEAQLQRRCLERCLDCHRSSHSRHRDRPGVGFRPFVWRLAQELNLTGWVRNDAEGVEIAAEGAHARSPRCCNACAPRRPRWHASTRCMPRMPRPMDWQPSPSPRAPGDGPPLPSAPTWPCARTVWPNCSIRLAAAGAMPLSPARTAAPAIR